MSQPRTDLAPGRFPADFTWGTATAAYQIEGAVREDGRGESIWDRFSHTPGKTHNGDTGDVACDHYHRWQGDIELMRRLHVNAYRFSIAWPRILPEGWGRVNPPGLDFYDRLVDGLLAAGITPWVTLYHWDLPQALEDRGGWPNPDTSKAFAEYADVVTRRLGDRVKHWITLNEPWVVAFLGYFTGEHAPGRKEPESYLPVVHNLLLAHGLAVPVIRENSRDSQVGITLNLTHAYPAGDSAEDEAAARRLDGFMNRWFLDPLFTRGYPRDMIDVFGSWVPSFDESDLGVIGAPLDFLGVNYYSPSFVRHSEGNPPLHVEQVRVDGEYTDMGWLVYPQGLYDLLTRLHRDYSPAAIVITENGAAYPDEPPVEGRVHDPKRVEYYASHLDAAQRAIRDGVPLRGYFAWSLMDNFEWAFGYSKRFGLYYVDYETLERTIKDSGLWYSRVVAEGQLVPTESVA